ncbi:hypothetical protein TWF217_007895 [Orbilia oligospora]|nr:hypothetical protein TWF217_007895 [Orbilia oligospora]
MDSWDFGIAKQIHLWLECANTIIRCDKVLTRPTGYFVEFELILYIYIPSYIFYSVPESIYKPSVNGLKFTQTKVTLVITNLDIETPITMRTVLMMQPRLLSPKGDEARLARRQEILDPSCRHSGLPDTDSNISNSYTGLGAACRKIQIGIATARWRSHHLA